MTTKTILGFLLLCTVAAWSQTERGGIRGTVKDPTGAVVPAAKVTVTNVATGVNVTTASNDSGTYTVTALPPGNYRVEASVTGFRTLVRENVTVNAASVTGLDLALEVGTATDVVTVSSAGPILKTESSDVSTQVSAQTYVGLPLTSARGGRYAAGFLQLVPGWTTNGTTPDTNKMQDSINGGQLSSKEIQMDGVSTITIEITGDGRNTIWPVDTVQELSVATSGYNAEYGNSGGGEERYVLKSGTNELHGNAYEFFRNNALDARGFFSPITPVHHENEFGFTVGAPIVIPKLYNGRNKSFVFFGINWYRFTTGGTTSIVSLPNDAFRRGDLSANPQQIYDPNTTQQLANGTFTRSPFPGNIIPQDRISQAALNILNLVPRSTTQAAFNNYAASANHSFTNYNTYTIKGDHYFNAKHHLSISNVYAGNPFYSAGILPHPIETGYGPIRTFTYDFGRLTEDWTISSTMLNQFRMGVNRQTQFSRSPEDEIHGNWPTKLGIPGLGLASQDFPTVNWGSFQTLASHNFSYPRSDTYVFSDALSWSKGRHAFKFGWEYRDNNHFFIFQNPVGLTFSRNETALPTAASTTGLEFASFLLGQVDSSTVSLLGGSTPHNIQTETGLYAQDDFKLNSKLTVNYGVRYDLYTPLIETHNFYSVMDPTAPNPAAGNIPGAYVFAGQNGQGDRLTYAKNNSHNFAPRFGLAWKATDKFVIRSGYGISYFLTGAYGAGNNTQVLQGYWFTSTAQSLNSGVTPGFVMDQGFPQNLLVVPPYLNPGLGVGSGTIQYWDPSAGRAAYAQNWNFTTQTQLASNLTLEVAYVGSKGTRLPARNTDPNMLNPAYYSLGTLLNSSISSAAVVAAGYKSPYPGFNGSLAQALRPFPQYVTSLAGALSSATIGNSTYHSLQTKLDKRFSNGLYAQAVFTWAKNLADSFSTSVGNSGQLGRDNYNRSLDKSPVPYGRPWKFVAAFTYDLPFGPGKRLVNMTGPVGKIIGGWQVSGIVTYSDGVPIQVTAPQSLPLNSGPQTPNIVPGVAQKGTWDGSFDPAKNRYLNIAAFTTPAPFTFGTAGLYLPNVFSPNYYNEDLALVKNTKIGERLELQLRLEAFNVFNRVVFGAPSSNVGTASTFGVISSQANAARNGQIAMKLTF